MDIHAEPMAHMVRAHLRGYLSTSIDWISTNVCQAGKVDAYAYVCDLKNYVEHKISVQVTE